MPAADDADPNPRLTPEQARPNLESSTREIAARKDWERRRLGLETNQELFEWQAAREIEERAQAHLDKARSWIDWGQVARDMRESRPQADGHDELRFDFRELIELAAAELVAFARQGEKTR
jgi:hypothetical protein